MNDSLDAQSHETQRSRRDSQTAIWLIAAPVFALGALSVFAGDFAYQWQPVPEWVPARTGLARLSGLLMMVLAAMLVLRPVARVAAIGLSAMFAIWVVLLHVPRTLSGEVAAWLGIFEFASLAAGCWLLTATMPGLRPERMTHAIARVVFAISLPAFGLSHFMYLEPAAALLPAWMPAKVFLTCLTAIGHIAAGISLLFGVLTRLATQLLCAMFASFVLLLHVPRVLANPTSRYEWTMLLVSLALNGAAWALAAYVASQANLARAAIPGVREAKQPA